MSNYIMSQIMRDQENGMQNKRKPGENLEYAEPLNNTLDKLIVEFNKNTSERMQAEEMLGIVPEDTRIRHISDLEKIKSQELAETENKEEKSSDSQETFESIINEIKENEQLMEVAIRHADEMSVLVKNAVMRYLDPNKPNKNGILMNNIPDVLMASARLLDLSINGRSKLAAMKKMRAGVLKDSLGGKSSNNEINLALLLGDDE